MPGGEGLPAGANAADDYDPINRGVDGGDASFFGAEGLRRRKVISVAKETLDKGK